MRPVSVSRPRLAARAGPPVRVLIVSGIFPPDIGGPATHSSDLAAELRKRGHDARVLTLTDEPESSSTPSVVRFPRRWPWPRAQRARLRVARDARQEERRRLCDRAHPDRGDGRAAHRAPGDREGRRRSGVGARITPRSDEPHLRRIPGAAGDRSPHPRHAIGAQPVDRRRDRGGDPERAPRRDRERVDGARRCDRRAQRRAYAAGGRDRSPDRLLRDSISCSSDGSFRSSRPMS